MRDCFMLLWHKHLYYHSSTTRMVYIPLYILTLFSKNGIMYITLKEVIEMTEVEIAYRVEADLGMVRRKLKGLGYVFQNTYHIVDKYYYNPAADNMVPKDYIIDDCFRIRHNRTTDELHMTIKKSIYDDAGNFVCTEEHTTEALNLEYLDILFKVMGVCHLVDIDNMREVYILGDYMLTIDMVADLGNFIEIEYLGVVNEEVTAERIREEIQRMAKLLCVDLYINHQGKPELMLRKLHERYGVING